METMNRGSAIELCARLVLAGLLLTPGMGCKATSRARIQAQSAKPAADKEKELNDFYAKVNREFEKVTFEMDDRRYSRFEIHYSLRLARDMSPSDVIRTEPEFVLQASFSKYQIVAYGWEYLDTIKPGPLRFKLSDLKELTPYDRDGFDICFHRPVSTFALNRSDFKIVDENASSLTLWMPGISAETQAKLKSLHEFLNQGIEEYRRLTGGKPIAPQSRSAQSDRKCEK